MKPWQDDQFNALVSVRTEHQLFDELAALVRKEGFDLCSYGIRPPFPLTQTRITVFDNFPARWHAQYRSLGYIAIDPTVRHAVRSVQPLVWSDEVFSDTRDFWEDARAQGLRYGWAQPCRDPSGVGGMLTVARSNDPITTAELKLKVPKLNWLTQTAHVAMTKLVMQKLLPEALETFTDREVDVMRWTAEGKSSADIAEILRISERTVNFHIGNVITKLNASNRTAAAIRMAMMGLLY
jgi:LuxR family transcriptional regulator